MKGILNSILVMVLGLTLLFSMTGCSDPGKSGSTYDEPEITVEYLSTDYAEQLIRDGATHTFGTIEIINDENGNPLVKIAEKEFVTDDTQANGYYIADKNSEVTYPLSYEARTTHLPGKTSIPNIMTSENFVKAVASDIKINASGNPEYEQSKLYDIYVIGDQIEMILARYLPQN